MGDEKPIRTLGDYSKPSHEGYRNTIELPVWNNVNPGHYWRTSPSMTTKVGDFAKPVKAISLPQDVPSTSDRRLIELENQVQRLMEAHLAPTQPTQQAFVVYASSRTNEVGGKRFTPNQGPRNFNDAANTWKEKQNFNCAHTQPLLARKAVNFTPNPLGYQVKLEKALLDFDSHQEKRLSYLRTQLEQQQDDMIGKINLLGKTVFTKLNDASTPKNAGKSMAPKSIVAISHAEKEELRKKGIKSPSKLFSLKYLSPASIKELNKNPSAPKHVRFVNSIVILSTDSDKEEEDISSHWHMSYNANENNIAILASSSEVPSVLEFLQRRKLEAKKEVAASEFSHLNHSLSHRPVSVKPDISKPDISKASSAGGKLHILKPSCERNGITPTPKEILSPTSGSKVPNSPITGKNEESYKFPIAVQQSFNSLWSQDVRGDPDSGIGGHWRSSDSGMYKFILILRALAVFRFRRALAVFRFRHAFTKNGIACIYLEGPPHHDFSLMDILPGKSTRLFNSPNDLWVKVVKAFHGHEGDFDNNGCSLKGTWAIIVGSSNFLHSKGIILNNSFCFNAGCGTRIRFWKDIWVGEAPFYQSRTNIGVRILAFFRDMLNEIGQLNIVASEDTCVWNLGPNGTFTVNIFMWILSLDRLPHRLNLSLRGMDILAISCSSCNANVESVNHIFFECIIASDLWKLVYRWCEITFVQDLSFEAFKDWLSSWHAPKEKKHRLFIISTSIL
ncbi:MAK10-like protein [Tanacetum coccineum]|uniref:MAK10-like protein n=1 Tax=Tanacetum coccineum TaxID=301880 RepID=A0ABQ5EKL8_9ASTR